MKQRCPAHALRIRRDPSDHPAVTLFDFLRMAAAELAAADAEASFEEISLDEAINRIGWGKYQVRRCCFENDTAAGISLLAVLWLGVCSRQLDSHSVAVSEEFPYDRFVMDAFWYCVTFLKWCMFCVFIWVRCLRLLFLSGEAASDKWIGMDLRLDGSNDCAYLYDMVCMIDFVFLIGPPNFSHSVSVAGDSSHSWARHCDVIGIYRRLRNPF